MRRDDHQFPGKSPAVSVGSNDEANRVCCDKFELAFHAYPDPILITRCADGKILEANEAFDRVYGQPAAQIIGRTTVELGIWSAAERGLMIERLRTDGRVRNFESVVTVHGGARRCGLISVEPVRIDGEECLVCVFRDITEQKAAEDNLRASEERLLATIQNTPHVAVQWYDSDGRILFWSPASEAMFGWKASEAVGKTLDQLIHTPEEAAGFLNLLSEIERTGKTAGPLEYPFRRRDGTRGICLSTTYRIPASGGRFWFACMDVDITVQKQAAEAFQLTQAEALSAREEFTQRLISAQEQERKRLANELHDGLGQSLSLIKNNASLALRDRDIPESARVRMENVTELVTQAIDEVRNLAYNLRPLHIDQFGLTDSLGELIQRARESGAIQIDRRLENVDDLFAGEEATNIYRAMQEALNNVVKHSRAKRARVVMERDLHCVRIRIEDDGKGFDLRKVTEARRTKTGIGLNSIGERVRMLGGELAIDTAPDRGTRIRIELRTHPAVAGPPGGAVRQSR